MMKQDHNRGDAEQMDSSGTEHTPDTSDTSLKQQFPGDEPDKSKSKTHDAGNGGDKKSKSKSHTSSKDHPTGHHGKSTGSSSGSKNVKETLTRLLRK